MEEKLYEARPIVYLILAVCAFVSAKGSILILSSGGLLAVAGIWTWRMRHNYRMYYRQLANHQARNRNHF